MATKKKPCDCHKKKKEYGPIYYQGSNPSKKILDWLTEQSEDGKVVYFQSGVPPCIPRPGHPCPK